MFHHHCKVDILYEAHFFFFYGGQEHLQHIFTLVAETGARTRRWLAHKEEWIG
jgi:hypothetical protein